MKHINEKIFHIYVQNFCCCWISFKGIWKAWILILDLKMLLKGCKLHSTEIYSSAAVLTAMKLISLFGAPLFHLLLPFPTAFLGLCWSCG